MRGVCKGKQEKRGKQYIRGSGGGLEGLGRNRSQKVSSGMSADTNVDHLLAEPRPHPSADPLLLGAQCIPH